MRHTRPGRLTRKLMELAVSAVAVLVVGGLYGALGAGSAAAGPAGAAKATPADPAAREAGRRSDELVKQGFNLTQSVDVGGAGPVQIELWIPPGEPEHTIALWFEAERGDASLRWLGPGDEVVTQWRGRQVEQRMRRGLAPGKHHIEIRADGGLVHGVIGVKGPVVDRCAIDPARLTEQPADPALGFAWPYLLVASRPAAGAAGAATLLVVPPNTGFATEDVELLRTSTTCAVADQLALADRLGTPITRPRPPAATAPRIARFEPRGAHVL